MRGAGIAAVIAALSVAGCSDTGNESSGESGGSDAASTTSEAVATTPLPCEDLKGPAQRTLEASLTADGGGSLRNGTVVQVEGVQPFAGQDVDVYVIRADLDAAGAESTELTWVANERFVESGGGFAVGADAVTKESSEMGSGVPKHSPLGEYAADVLAAAPDCP